MTGVLFRGKPRTKRNRIAAKTCLAVPARVPARSDRMYRTARSHFAIKPNDADQHAFRMTDGTAAANPDQTSRTRYEFTRRKTVASA
jgi:hypothetical protein